VELSVVILNYNASAFLEFCLDSVFKATTTINTQVIVVDNASSDDSLGMVAQQFPQVKIIALEENFGFSKANNMAVKEATGDYLCILNPDTVVGEQVFVECLAFAKALPLPSSQPVQSTGIAQGNLGFVGVQLIDGSGSFLPESKRHIPTPKVARQKLLGNNQSYYYNEVDREARGAVDVLVGAFMFCKRTVYESCGGFDERYFMYGEDIDLSYTALQQGYVNYYLGDLKVIHFKGESTVKDQKYLKRFYGAMELFYDKYFKRSLLEQALIKCAITSLVWLKSGKHKSTTSEKLPQILVTEKCTEIEFLKGVNRKVITELGERKDVQFIWDTNSYSFSRLIDFMEANGSSSQYRFLNASGSQIIGSDRSDDRGEVKKTH
jgi:GT2 family glycosyltransferase